MGLEMAILTAIDVGIAWYLIDAAWTETFYPADHDDEPPQPA